MLPSHIKYYQKNKSNEGLQNDGADIDFVEEYDNMMGLLCGRQLLDEMWEKKTYKAWLKAYRSEDIIYKFVGPIPLTQRVKKWNVPPDSLLTRLEVLEECNKLSKNELLPMIKEYRKERVWNKSHAKRFGKLLKKVKGKTNNGRYILFYVDSDKASKKLEDRRTYLNDKIPITFPYQTVGGLVVDINRKLWRLYNDQGPPPEENFFIGPIMYWKKTGNKYDPISAESQFSYTVNCHGDYVNQNPIPRKFVDWLDWI